MAGPAEADTSAKTDIGLRLGTPAGIRDEGFSQYELTITRDLPWRLELAANKELITSVGFSAGILGAGGEESLLLAAGPNFGVNFFQERVFLWIGSSAAYLSHSRFQLKNMGGKLQFISGVNATYRFLRNVGLTVRFQHMSTGSLSRPNPGLNLLNLSASYQF